MIPRPGAQGQPFGVYEWGESEIELFPDSAAREFADELRVARGPIYADGHLVPVARGAGVGDEREHRSLGHDALRSLAQRIEFGVFPWGKPGRQGARRPTVQGRGESGLGLEASGLKTCLPGNSQKPVWSLEVETGGVMQRQMQLGGRLRRGEAAWSEDQA